MNKHPLSSRLRPNVECAPWVIDEVKKLEEALAPEHVLYKREDPDVPDTIKDRNGDIVLGLCRICGKGEAELVEPCVPPAKLVYQRQLGTPGYWEDITREDWEKAQRGEIDNRYILACETRVLRETS